MTQQRTPKAKPLTDTGKDRCRAARRDTGTQCRAAATEAVNYVHLCRQHAAKYRRTPKKLTILPK